MNYKLKKILMYAGLIFLAYLSGWGSAIWLSIRSGQ